MRAGATCNGGIPSLGIKDSDSRHQRCWSLCNRHSPHLHRESVWVMPCVKVPASHHVCTLRKPCTIAISRRRWKGGTFTTSSSCNNRTAVCVEVSNAGSLRVTTVIHNDKLA